MNGDSSINGSRVPNFGPAVDALFRGLSTLSDGPTNEPVLAEFRMIIRCGARSQSEREGGRRARVDVKWDDFSGQSRVVSYNVA